MIENGEFLDLRIIFTGWIQRGGKVARSISSTLSLTNHLVIRIIYVNHNTVEFRLCPKQP